MSAPSISGFTVLRTTTVTTGITIVGAGGSIGTITGAADRLNIAGITYSPGNYHINIPTDSTLNLTGNGIFFGLGLNLNLGTVIQRFALASASGHRYWNAVASSNAGTLVEFYLDLEGNSFTDVGSFNLSAVTSIQYYFSPSGSNTNRTLTLLRPLAFDKGVGVIIGGGEVGNPVTPGSISSLQLGLLSGSTQAVRTVGANYCEFPIPLTLSPVVSSFANGSFVFSEISYLTNTTGTPRTAIATRLLRANTSTANTFSGFQIVGLTGAEFDFSDVSSAANSYTSDFLILRHAAVNLGLANWAGTFSSGTGAITGGAIMGGAIRGNTASYAIEWNGTTTFVGLDLTGTSNAHYINCNGANFTTGATLDISGITFGTPGVRKVRVNAAGKTLNIATAGGFTIDDVTVVAGTVNIVAPVTEVTLTQIQPGSKVRIYATGTQTEMAGNDAVSGSTFVFEPSGAFDIRIFKTGFQVFRSINNPVPASDQSIQINQLIDRGYFDAP